MKLSTNRFILRDFMTADAAAFVAYHADPRSFKFDRAREFKRDHADRLLTKFRLWADEQPRRNYQLAVVQRNEPHELIGCVGLRTEGLPMNVAEFGIEIAPTYWGRVGYALEIADAMLQYGFYELSLDAVSGTTIPENTRITKLALWYGADITSAPREANSSNHCDANEIRWRLTFDQWERYLRGTLRRSE